MAQTPEEFEGDWLHGVFDVFREEVVSLAADFGQRVKAEIDAVADTAGIQPPSATALLTSVAIETTNMTSALFGAEPPDDDEADEQAQDQGPPSPQTEDDQD